MRRTFRTQGRVTTPGGPTRRPSAQCRLGPKAARHALNASASLGPKRRSGDAPFARALRAVQRDESAQETETGAKSDKAFNLLPVYEKTFADHLNPILAYRCITKEDSREAPSFLFESVE